MRRSWATAAFAMALLALVLLPTGTSTAVSFPADATVAISGTPDLLSLLASPVSDSTMVDQAISQDGRRVVFTSNADGLVDGDDDDITNVYVKDTATGAVTLVSRATGVNGEPAHARCSEPVISDDATRVAFTCNGALDPADTNMASDVYVRDLVSSQTMLVSRVGGLGVVGDMGGEHPTIDATGEHVAFESRSSNLIFGASPGFVPRVYWRRLGTGDPVIILSVPTGALSVLPSAGSDAPSMSDDGSIVAFESDASLDAADPNTRADVYVHDVGQGTTQLVSRADGPDGAAGNGLSRDASMSGNGDFVAFVSKATNFDVDHDSSSDDDIYRRALTARTTQLISVRIDGTKANAPSRVPSIDDSGDVVAFVSQATNLDPAAPTPGQLYVRRGAQLSLVSRRDGPNGTVAAGVSTDAVAGDGTKVAFATQGVSPDVDSRHGTVAIRDLDAATTRIVSRPAGAAPFVNDGGDASGGSVSADGRYVAFTTEASGLGVPRELDDEALVRDTLTGAITVASRQDGADGALIDGVSDAVISGDGRRVAFTADGGFGPTSGSVLYVRHLVSGRTFIASRADGLNGALANQPGLRVRFTDTPHMATISDDGARVAFVSGSTNLSPDDGDTEDDVYVRDVDAGRTYLVSRATGLTGAKANAAATDSSISGDGRHVAFDSHATNLDDRDTTTPSDVYVRSIDTGTTLLVSGAGNPARGSNGSTGPSISRDGNRVSFVSFEQSFQPDPRGEAGVFVRDIAARTLIVAGRADGPVGVVPDALRSPAMLSADGTTIAFTGAAQTSIAPGTPLDSVGRIFVRNLTTGTTRLVSRATGLDGAASPVAAALGGITADGACVVFSAPAALVPGPHTDFSQVYMRASRLDCGRPPMVQDGGRPGGGPGGGPSGGGGSPPVLDGTAPRLSSVRLSRSRFRIGPAKTALTAVAVARGTVLSLRVSEAARLTVTVDRERPGRRAGRKKPTCKVVAKTPRTGACTAYVHDATLSRTLQAGSARIAFSGRLGSKRLAVGRHRLTLVARDAAGNASEPVTLHITVVV